MKEVRLKVEQHINSLTNELISSITSSVQDTIENNKCTHMVTEQHITALKILHDDIRVLKQQQNKLKWISRLSFSGWVLMVTAALIMISKRSK